jgi:ABC-type phosphate transport system permease subunit
LAIEARQGVLWLSACEIYSQAPNGEWRENMTAKASKGKKANLVEFAIEGLIRTAGISAIVFVALIFFFLIREGAPAFTRVPLSELLGKRWYPIFDIYGTLPLILGSLAVTVGAVVISLPLGLATAVFIGEIAPDWAR